MKNSIKIFFGAIAICCICASCSDMLETSTNRYLDTDGDRLNSDNDTLYSVIGILKQLEAVGERYMVLGEVRGDLVDLTSHADMDLLAISNFSATTDNPYASTREYYAVINNCNYFLQRADTSVTTSSGRKALLGEYAVVKAIRAWTYLQLGLNFGKAVWFTEPLLTVDDMNRPHEELTLEALLSKLMDDISPYLNVRDYPNYGTINYASRLSFIPVPVLMGELFLWMGTCTNHPFYYQMAASFYYTYLVDASTRSVLNVYMGQYSNAYIDADFQTIASHSNYSNAYLSTREIVSLIAIANPNFAESRTVPQTEVLCLPYDDTTWKITPSQAAMSLWNNEIYLHYNKENKEVTPTKGDLRGYSSKYNMSLNGSYEYYTKSNEADSMAYIMKYGYIGSTGRISPYPRVIIYRSPLLFLHYAEALNGLGKPSTAFAVLKYGLSTDVLSDNTKVTSSEVDPLPPYCDFTGTYFDNQRGVHGRGSGNPEQDTVYYAFTEKTLQANRDYYGFPAALNSKADSIQFVNTMICKELALETAFEGNRFHDLMRFSKHHEYLTGRNDFLAKWVARRNPALEGKLLHQNAWFLPSK